MIRHPKSRNLKVSLLQNPYVQLCTKMAPCAEFLVVVSSYFVVVGATIPYKTAYFGQDLDHFNFVQANKVTFKQQYLYTDQYWDEKGPIFFYTGNEGSITSFWENSGFVFEVAQKFNALVIFGEHASSCSQTDLFKVS